MEVENPKIKVYASVLPNGDIVGVQSGLFLDNPVGWKVIDEGYGDRFAHAQSQYFEKPIMTDKGIYRYTRIDGVTGEKTEEELIDAGNLLPPAPLTETEKLKQRQEATEAATEFMLNIIMGGL